ncbi:MAG: EamA family transporter [bacterium]|jgi:drug/metabolite transporter (DMT)-like permease|nr:EamA family transporter [bacterium]
MLKLVILILTGVFVTAWGNIFVSKGMRSVDVSLHSWRDLVKTLVCVVSSGWVMVGTGLLICSFILWMIMLSMADLSLLLPMTALDYVVNAFLAKVYLNEHVSPLRWLGTVVIFLGVAVVVAS